MTRATHLQPRHRRRQRGALVVHVAIALSLVVILLIGTELGYLFYLKREMQKSVDLAALAGAQALQPHSCTTATTAATTNATANLPPGLTLTPADVSCGRWDPATRAAPLHFGPVDPGENLNAVQITMSRTPALLMPGLPGNQARTISVSALAAQRTPRAALHIRSTLASVDSTRATVLNAVFGGMLGGAVNIDAVGWNGLLGTDVQLLGYLDALAVELNVAAGRYDQVLNTQASVGTLLQAAISALQRQGGTAQVVLNALDTVRLAANAAAIQPALRLGDLLGVQSGSQADGLRVDLQVFQLLEGMVQLANAQNGVIATVPFSVPGLATVTTKVRVIEPPRMSAVGDPTLARLAPDGADRIYVRTAQVRTLVSVDLPALNGVSALLSAVTSALAPVTTLLDNVLSLNLVSVLNCLFCTRNLTDIDLLPPPVRLDLNLDAGGGESRVTDFNCDEGSHSLTASTRTAAAELRVGKMGATAAQASTQVFSSSAAPHVDPVPLLDIGSLPCFTLASLITLSCNEAARKPYFGGGLALQVDLPVAAASATQVFANPPTLDNDDIVYQAVSSSNLVDSLGTTLHAGANMLRAVPATGSPNGGLPSVLAQLVATLSTVITQLGNVLSGVLSPLLDGLLNTLLHDMLGIDLAKTEVGGQLSCTKGAELVY